MRFGSLSREVRHFSDLLSHSTGWYPDRLKAWANRTGITQVAYEWPMPLIAAVEIAESKAGPGYDPRLNDHIRTFRGPGGVVAIAQVYGELERKLELLHGWSFCPD